MCGYVKRRGKCLGGRCDACIFARSDTEYAVLKEQEQQLKNALLITRSLMELREMEMKQEVITCANG